MSISSNDNLINTNIMIIEDGIRLAIEMARQRFEMNTNDIVIPYIVSTPGTGKSSLFEIINSEYNYGSSSYTIGLKPIEQLSGLPCIDEIKEQKRVHWLAPELIDEIWDLSKKFEFSTVLIDDFHLCNTQIQSYGFELFTYHKLHGYKLPKNVQFVVAGNTTSMAGAKQSLSAIMNRMIKIPVKPDRKTWLKNFAEPKNLNSIVCSFLRNNINDIYFCEPESCDPTGSPRSWTGLAYALDIASKRVNLSKNINLFETLARGCISPTASTEFTSFYSIYSKVDVESIFKSNGQIEFQSSTEKYPTIIAITDYVLHNIIEFAETTKFQTKLFVEEYKNICKIMKIYSNIIEVFRQNRDHELSVLSTHMLLTSNIKFNINNKVISMMDIISTFVVSNIISSDIIHNMAQEKSNKSEYISSLMNS